MYKLKQRITAFLLTFSIFIGMFLDCTVIVSANSSVGTGFLPLSEYISSGSETLDNIKNWVMNVIDCAALALCNSISLKYGDYERIISNNKAFGNSFWDRMQSENLLSEIYIEQGKDLENASVKCSTAFIDWLCKELNNYYVSVNKENISDYYDKTKGYYDYGSTNVVSYDLLYGENRNGKVGVRMIQHFGTNKTLSYQYPIYGLLSENKNALTGTSYYMADLYFYNPLLADKTVDYNVSNNIKINVQAVRNGLALAANSSYANSQGILDIYAAYGVNSTLGSLYILEDGTLGTYGGYKGDTGRMVAFYNLPSIALSDPANVAKDPSDPFSTWKYTNLQLRTKIPFFDSYEKLEKAYKTGDLTEAVNFSKLSAFAGGYSGDDVTYDADTLKKIESILDDASLDIQDKIDQLKDLIGDIGDGIGGAGGDNTEEVRKTNEWLRKIKEVLDGILELLTLKLDSVPPPVPGTDSIFDTLDAFSGRVTALLDDILGTLKSIRRWAIADTIIDGIDLAESLVKDVIDITKGLFKTPVSAFKTVMQTVETLGDALSVKFPFCIPWDVAFLLNLLRASPKPPHYEIPLKYGGDGSLISVDETIVLDFEQFGILSIIGRSLLTIIFCKGLLDLTFKIVMLKEKENDAS